MTRKRGRAFTLAEVILSLGLLAAVALGLLGLLVSARTSSEGGMARVEAAALADSELRRIKQLPYDQLKGYLTTPLPGYEVPLRGSNYRIDLIVSRFSTDISQMDYEVLKLDLRLSWMQKDRIVNDGQHQLGADSVRRQINLFSAVAPESSV